MNKIIGLFIAASLFLPVMYGAAVAASCSKANLTRCLDSACALNIGSNPAARCQLCGTAQAGSAATDTGLKSLSVGASAKNTLSATELKSAPSDPGTRYAWATGECIKKIAGCTQDDVTNAYDRLIEQSCKAAGITSGMAELQLAARKTKTQTSCNTEIRACLTDAKHCGPNYAACAQDTDFDRFFSACAVDASGCTEHVNAVRTELASARDGAIKNQETLLANIVGAYQTARDTKLKSAEDSCKDNKAKTSCVKTVCETNMKNKCGVGFESEKSMANLLCAFHDTACQRLK
ncbi:MAG: hypothetical protein LBF37_00800 [Rickettsiales bacterium]|jgi:hypothetical protein|nr:hypothetical protein [Rickettsiales bacterium]